MPIKFSCHACGLTLSVKDEFAGRACKCKCGTQLNVPTNVPVAAVAAPAQPADAFQSIPQQVPAVPPAHPNTPNQPGAMLHQVAPAQQEQPEVFASVKQSLSVDSVQCVECGKKYALKPEFYGKTIKCGCGAPVRMDHPLGYVPSHQQFVDRGQGKVVDASARSEDEILNQYIDKNSVREVRNDPDIDEDDPFAYEKKLLYGSVSSGLLAIIGGTVWLVIGLNYGWLFYYPVILIVLGMVAVLMGIIKGRM